MKSHEDFVVGKKYKSVHSSCVFVCIGHRLDGTAFLENTEVDWRGEAKFPENWTEYKEPREYWIVPGKGYSYIHEFDAQKAAIAQGTPINNIVHVKEVID